MKLFGQKKKKPATTQDPERIRTPIFKTPKDFIPMLSQNN